VVAADCTKSRHREGRMSAGSSSVGRLERFRVLPLDLVDKYSLKQQSTCQMHCASA